MSSEAHESVPTPGPVDAPQRRFGLRRVLGIAVMVAVVAGGSLAVYHQRHEFVDTLHKVGIAVFLGSFACGVLGVVATFPQWRQVLKGLGVNMPWRGGSKVFFTTQLGKYLPGSVWPVLMQMEAGRRRGANRMTMLAANIFTLLISCCIGLILGSLLLPMSGAKALDKYSWTLIAIPLLLTVLHPRFIPAVIDRAAHLTKRPLLHSRLDFGAELKAAGWSVASWVGLGLQLVVLCAAVGHGGVTTFALCIGGMALAYSLGVLFIPAPAGAGIREIVLTLVLESILDSGQALAVVVASRVMLIATDMLLAGVAMTLRDSAWTGPTSRAESPAT